MSKVATPSTSYWMSTGFIGSFGSGNMGCSSFSRLSTNAMTWVIAQEPRSCLGPKLYCAISHRINVTEKMTYLSTEASLNHPEIIEEPSSDLSNSPQKCSRGFHPGRIDAKCRRELIEPINDLSQPVLRHGLSAFHTSSRWLHHTWMLNVNLSDFGPKVEKDAYH